MSAVRLSDLVCRDLDEDPLIEGVTADSRKVKPGYLFAALPGAAVDGRRFVASALAAGAAAVLTGEALADIAVPQVTALDPRRAYALAAAAFWGAQPTVCVAVTGTNGKTSVATFCRQIFERLGHASASMGTLGVRAGDDQLTPPGLTTPDAGERRPTAWPNSPAAASLIWRWRPRRTGSTSAGSTACALARRRLPQPDPGPSRLSRHDGGLSRRQAAAVRGTAAARRRPPC